MLLRFDYTQKYIPFDFETLNLCINIGDTDFQAPWQLGYLLCKGNNVIATKEKYIWWDDFKSKADKYGRDALRITKFDYNKYCKLSENAEVVLKEFDKYLLSKDNFTISANGINFDQYIYDIYRELLGWPREESWHNNHIDIQCIEKANELGITFPKVGTDEWGEFMLKMSSIRQKGLKTSIEFLCKKYGVGYDSSRHHVEASYDCVKTYEIFWEQIRKIPITK